MIIKDTVLHGDGSIDVVEIEVDDNYFDPHAEEPEPTTDEVLDALLGVTNNE